VKIISTFPLTVFFWKSTIPPPFFAAGAEAAFTAFATFFEVFAVGAPLPSSITLVGKYPAWRNWPTASLVLPASMIPTDSCPR